MIARDSVRRRVPSPARTVRCVRLLLFFLFVFGGEARSSEDRRKNRVGDREAGKQERASGAREKTEEEREQWGWETGGAYSGARRDAGGGGGGRPRERVTGGPGCGDPKPKSRIRHAAVYRS